MPEEVRPFRVYNPDDDNRRTASVVREVVEPFIEEKRLQLQAGAVGKKTLEKIVFYLTSFLAMYGDKRISACRQNDLTKWLLAHPEWESTATKTDAVRQVIACFRWAAPGGEGELIDACPYRSPKFLGPPIKPRAFMAPEHYRALRRVARKAVTSRGRRARSRGQFRAMLCFLWWTGARTCEAREALWEQVDWQRQVIRQDVGKTTKVTGESREIPIGRVLPLLRWLHKHRQPGTHIFVNSLGRPWTCDRFAKEFRRYADMADVPKKISAYCARHGFTILMAENGASDREMACALGQKGTANVRWYVHGILGQAGYINSVAKMARRKRRTES